MRRHLRTDESGGMRYGDGALQLSLSHSRDLIGIALATVRVGLDIEWPRPRASVDLAARVFSSGGSRTAGYPGRQ